MQTGRFVITQPIHVIERNPSVEEYLDLIASVNWRRRDPEAVKIALGNSLFSVCAESEGQLVGMGRVIGDGGLHLYLADVVVRPDHQNRRIGSRIVAALTAFVEAFPFENTVAAIIPTAGCANM